jgi:chromosome partitioning protein
VPSSGPAGVVSALTNTKCAYFLFKRGRRRRWAGGVGFGSSGGGPASGDELSGHLGTQGGAAAASAGFGGSLMEDFRRGARNCWNDCDPAPVIGSRRGSNARQAYGAAPTGSMLAIVNQKGGVGKTTTAVNVSSALASLGHRVLLIDLDPQGNSTSGVGVSRAGLRMSMYDVLIGGDPMFHVIQPTAVERLDLAPSDVRLAGAEVELVPKIAREMKFKNAARAVREMYEVLIVDCPPSLGLLTVNALTAADGCLIPMQCEYYALEGVSSLLTTIELIRRHLNQDLKITGVLLTMVDARTRLSEQVAAEVRRHFGTQVFDTVVPRSVRLAEAPSHGRPIFTYAPESRGAVAYLGVAKEIAVRIGLGQPETGLVGAGEVEAVTAASSEAGGGLLHG